MGQSQQNSWVSGAQAVGRTDLAGILALAPTGHVTLGESFQISDTHSVFLTETRTGRVGCTQVSAGCKCLLPLCVASHGWGWGGVGGAVPLTYGPQPW